MESGTNRGSSRRQGLLVHRRHESRVPAIEGVSEVVVEHLGADLEQGGALLRERDGVREHVGDGRAQRAQPLRFVERLDLAEVAAIGPGDLSDLQGDSFLLVGPGTYLATSPRSRAVARVGPVGAGAPSRGAELAI
jgi:hypothetical protein